MEGALIKCDLSRKWNGWRDMEVLSTREQLAPIQIPSFICGFLKTLATINFAFFIILVGKLVDCLC